MSRQANRTQMIIGSIAVGLIAVIVVVGLVLNKKQNSSPVTDHPVSTNSTASVAGGVVTVTAGGTPAVTIDMYEDPICPVCKDFEAQFGQQMMKGVDDGKLAIRYHFLDFLNPNSASKTYSSRAAAAFACVAAVPAGEAPKGLFMNFHTTMFGGAVQPAEGSGVDLSNAQIAQIAAKAGAPASATTCIAAGTGVAAAQAASTAGQATLTRVIGSGWGTPTVLQDDKPVGINSTDWLTKLIG